MYRYTNRMCTQDPQDPINSGVSTTKDSKTKYLAIFVPEGSFSGTEIRGNQITSLQLAVDLEGFFFESEGTPFKGL